MGHTAPSAVWSVLERRIKTLPVIASSEQEMSLQVSAKSSLQRRAASWQRDNMAMLVRSFCLSSARRSNRASCFSACWMIFWMWCHLSGFACLGV